MSVKFTSYQSFKSGSKHKLLEYLLNLEVYMKQQLVSKQLQLTLGDVQQTKPACVYSYTFLAVIDSNPDPCRKQCELSFKSMICSLRWI